MPRLDDVFAAALLSASAAGCGVAGDVPDASAATDATADEASALVPIDGETFLDGYVPWCEAGPPIPFASQGCCCGILEVPCGIPLSDRADDAGNLWNCFRYCGGDQSLGCKVYDEADASDGSFVECCGTGRRFAGFRAPRAATLREYFGALASLEAASVLAFDRLAGEIKALGASPRLIARARRAMRDEQRHTRTMVRLGRSWGAVVTLPSARRFRRRGAVAVALENAVEGQIRETYGALVATWQAVHAGDATVRRAMRTIARDETRHSRLAASVASFLDQHLDRAERQRVRRTSGIALTTLRAEIARATPSPDVVATLGVPTRTQAMALFDVLAPYLAKAFSPPEHV